MASAIQENSKKFLNPDGTCSIKLGAYTALGAKDISSLNPVCTKTSKTCKGCSVGSYGLNIIIRKVGYPQP